MADLRLFWALNLPAALKAELGRFQAELKKILPEAKWVKQENLHLTVKFLGNVDSSLLSAITGKVAGELAALAPFQLELAGWGTFGRPPRVIWVGVKGNVPALQELQARIEAALSPLGFPVEDKTFAPHLTLCRLRSTVDLTALRERAGILTAGRDSWGGLMVEQVELMRSDLTREGPIYRVMDKVSLNGG